MSQRMKLFIFLLIVNLIVIVIYLVWNHIRRKSPECLDEGGHDVSVSCSRAYVCAAFFYPV